FVKTKDEQGELWQAAGGWFEAWPQDINALKTIDPCCGSGHFLVALFLMLVPMRMQLEGLDAKTAIDKVLTENLHGLELDSRCVEIAAFALALEAWRYPNAGGYRTLPALNIASSGLDVSAASKEWQALAKHNPDISEALSWFTRTFKDAPVLGSLIDVNTAYYDGKAEGKPAPWQVLLDAQASMQNQGDDEAQTAQVTAQGLAMAAKLLSNQYNLVATNVPYLARGKQCDTLKDFCESDYPEAKPDLATVFLERCLNFSPTGGTSTIVLPQNWLFLTSYKKFREKLLTQDTWNLVARLGEKGFESSAAAGAFVAMVTLSKGAAPQDAMLHGLDVSAPKTAVEKADQLMVEPLKSVEQTKQLDNPDARIVLTQVANGPLLCNTADFGKGSTTGDKPRFMVGFWELPKISEQNTLWLDSPSRSGFWSGRSQITTTSIDSPTMQSQLGCWLRGQDVWNKAGVAVNKMRSLEPFLYSGEVFDDNICPIAPADLSHIPALYAYVESAEYAKNVRAVDQKLNVTAATITKVPFDLSYWT
ncbi:MAG: Eco57I restriction-modification methylase domain-containing protein, partial [Plesiomonas shigelloides]